MAGRFRSRPRSASGGSSDGCSVAEVFPFAHNWRELYKATIGYGSSIWTAEDDTEQRAQLRILPTRSDTLQVHAGGEDDPGESALLDAVLFAGQTTQWAVPRWPDAATLLEDAAAGTDVVVSLET